MTEVFYTGLICYDVYRLVVEVSVVAWFEVLGYANVALSVVRGKLLSLEENI